MKPVCSCGSFKTQVLVERHGSQTIALMKELIPKLRKSSEVRKLLQVIVRDNEHHNYVMKGYWRGRYLRMKCRGSRIFPKVVENG